MTENTSNIQESFQDALTTANAAVTTMPSECQSPLINKITTNGPIPNESDLTPGRRNLRKWLGKTFRVVISDGRVLVGYFNCTDKDANVVLSMCAEYLEKGKDARLLGNVMIPGKHIVSISVDMPKETHENEIGLQAEADEDEMYT